MADVFTKIRNHEVGPGGLTCDCCNKFKGSDRKIINKIARKKMSRLLQQEIEEALDELEKGYDPDPEPYYCKGPASVEELAKWLRKHPKTTVRLIKRIHLLSHGNQHKLEEALYALGWGIYHPSAATDYADPVIEGIWGTPDYHHVSVFYYPPDSGSTGG